MVQNFDQILSDTFDIPKEYKDMIGGNYYHSTYKGGGRPVQIRCVDEFHYDAALQDKNQGFLQFGGYCDPNIMLVEGMY